jgi:hypothetical protein
MITDTQKETLRDLLLQERVSDILQTMVTLAAAEATRLGRPIMTLDVGSKLRHQTLDAAKQATVRLEILQQATREATAREGVAAFVSSITLQLGQPVQMALL